MVAILTEAYQASPFCLCELGAAWITTKRLIPILVPPLRFEDLKAVLLSVQALRIEDGEGLDQVHQTLTENVGFAPHDLPTWNREREKFLVSKPWQGGPSFQGPVPREKFLKIERELSEYRAALDQSRKAASAQDKVIESLSRAKDAHSVAEAKREHLEPVQKMDTLVQDCSDAVKKLHKATAEALFSYGRNEIYRPQSQDAWDAARQAIERKEVIVAGDDDALAPNTEHARVQAAIKSLDSLGRFLSGPESEAADAFYASQHDGESPDIQSRDFWDRCLW